MQVVEVTDLKSWDCFKNDWLRLQEACSLSHPFMDWNWIRPWGDYLPSEQKRPLILIIKNQDNDVVGIAPFQINQEGLYRCIEGFAQEFADYIDWLYQPGWEVETGKAICEWLFGQRKRSDYIRIINILPDGLAYRTLIASCPDTIRPHSIAPHVEIKGAYDDFTKTLKSKFLSDTRRRKRKLAREIGGVEYFVVKHSKDIPQLLDYVKLWLGLRQREKRETSYLDRVGMYEHLTTFYEELYNLGMLHFSGFRINNSVVALNIAFKYKNSIFSYTPVFDPAFKRYSIIRLLKFQHIRECYDNRLFVYDFCLGGEKYKFSFNPVVKQLYSFTLYGETIKGRLIKIYNNKFKQHMKDNMLFERMKSFCKHYGIK